ncbi:MAG: PDZ domain-containing protein [Nitrospira sp.]|nr:PDZ domain-containing protein [Nitrospira sp.]
MQRRLQDVALPLLIAAAESCPFEQESTYGFFLHDETAQKGSQNAVNQSVDRKAMVAYVHPQLGAASAGLVVGDRVVRVNAKSVEGESADTIMRLVRRLTAARIQPLQLAVERDVEPQIVTMWAVPACQFSLRLIESDIINGVSNGRQVGVTTGAMRIFFWDDE